MAIQTFTAAQVLTAAQMNALQANDYNQTVSAKVASYTLVAADKGTRITMSNAAATTITVNTSLFAAGDSLRIQNIGAGACTITAGTATVTSAGPLALVQWAGGQLFFTSASAAIWFPDAVTQTTPGLVLVKTQTVGTTVASVEVTSAFNATYDAYKIILTGGTCSANNQGLTMVLGASVTTYSGGYTYYASNGSTVSPGTPGAVSTGTSLWQTIGTGTTSANYICMEMQNPFLAQHTYMQTTVYDPVNLLIKQHVGIHASNTSYSSFTIATATGTMTGGTIAVYGYAKA